METVISNAVASTTGTVTTVLTTNLPVIFTVFGALLALGLVLHYIKRLIGKKA